MNFEKDLEHIINIHSKENDSNTPDFILAQYMQSCLNAFNTATQQRETWYSRDATPSLSQQVVTADTGQRCVCSACGQPHQYRSDGKNHGPCAAKL